jgi:hypothetical protein
VALYRRTGEGWLHHGWLNQSKVISSLEWHPTDANILATGEGGQQSHHHKQALEDEKTKSSKTDSRFTNACTGFILCYHSILASHVTPVCMYVFMYVCMYVCM